MGFSLSDLDPTKAVKSVGRFVDNELIDPVKEGVQSAGRSIDEEVFQPVFDDIDDSYKQYVRPYMSEIGAAVATYLGLPPQAGAALGQMFEEGGLGGAGGGGSGGGGGYGFEDVMSLQKEAYDTALNEARDTRSFLRGQFAPYTQAGQSAINPLLAELGLPPQNAQAGQNSQLFNTTGAGRGSGFGTAPANPGFPAPRAGRASSSGGGFGAPPVNRAGEQPVPASKMVDFNRALSQMSGQRQTAQQPQAAQPYRNPLLDDIQGQTMRTLFNNRSSQGVWGAGDTPGVVARALLEPAYKMQRDRIGDLQGLMGLGAQTTGSMAGNETRMTDSIMDASVGQGVALGNVAMARAAAARDQQKQNDDMFGSLIDTGVNLGLNYLFGGNDTTGGGGSTGGGGWNFGAGGGYTNSNFDIFDLGA